MRVILECTCKVTFNGSYISRNISPLWLRWQLDHQGLIVSREAPIEGHFGFLGTYHEIYGHYLIVRSIEKKTIPSIYIQTTVGHIYFYREIKEAIQGFCQACSDDT